jgi:outer membrane protein TolC
MNVGLFPFLLVLGVLVPGEDALEWPLETCLTFALKQNRSLLTRTVSLEGSAMALAEAQQAFRWQWSLGAAAGSDGDPVLTSQLIKQSSYGLQTVISSATDFSGHGDVQSNWHFRLSVPLYNGFGKDEVQQSLRLAQTSYQRSLDGMVQSRQQLVFLVTQAYLNVLQQEKLVEIGEKSLERSQSLAEATEIKLRIGRVSKVDLYRVQTQLAQTELNLLTTKQRRDDAQVALLDLLGLSTHQAFRGIYVDFQLHQSEDLDLSALFRAAYHSFSYLQWEEDFKEATISLKLQKRRRFPKVQLSGDYRVSDVRNLMDRGDDFDQDSSVYLSTNLNRTQVQTQFDILAAQRTLTLLQLKKDDLLKNFRRSIRNQLTNIATKEKSIGFSQQTMENAKQQFEVAKSRFERGLIDNFQVIEAEKSYLDAAVSYESATNHLILAWIELKIFLNDLSVEELPSSTEMALLAPRFFNNPLKRESASPSP